MDASTILNPAISRLKLSCRLRCSSASVTQAAAPCNCLTKRYLQDGSVLFTDLCTKEQAMATPDELRAQAQGVSPQAQ